MISVIIPVYNAERYVAECLDSLLNSTYRDVELICVDDGSTDGSGGILDQYARQDKRVLVIHQQNQGVSAARNKGLDVARGEWVTFVDADDAWEIRSFEAMIEAWEKTGRKADIVQCGRLWHEGEELPHWGSIPEFPRSERILSWSEVRRNMLVWAFSWGKMIRKSFVGGHRFSKRLSYSEDTCFVFNLLGQKDHFCMVEACSALYLYRCNPQSACFIQPKEKSRQAYDYLLHCVDKFVSREARSVACEVCVSQLFSCWRHAVQVAPNQENAQAACGSLLLGLEMWRKSGFLNGANRLMFLKFYVYRFFPNLNRIGLWKGKALQMLRRRA